MATIFDPGSGYATPVERFATRFRRHPIQNDPSHWIERRHYQQRASDYAPLALGVTTGAPTGGYLLAQDLEGREGNLVYFWRDYGNKPATREEPGSYAYEFIGYALTLANGGRRRFSATVDALIEYSYYIDGVDTAMASVPRQRYVNNFGLETDFLTDITTPTVTAYETMVTNGTYIVAEDSTREIYMGPIVCRKVIRVKAQ
jgi:hypothetical protein